MKEEFKKYFLETINLKDIPENGQKLLFNELEKQFKEDSLFINYIVDSFENLKNGIEENNFIFTNHNNENYITINNILNIYINEKKIEFKFEKDQFMFTKDIESTEFEAKIFNKKSTLPIMRAINLYINENNNIDFSLIEKISNIFNILRKDQNFITILDLVPIKTETTYQEIIKKLTNISGILLLQELNLSPYLNELKNLNDNKNKNKAGNT